MRDTSYHSVWLNPPTNTIPNPNYRVHPPLQKGALGTAKSIKIGYHSTYNNIIFTDMIEGGDRIINNEFADGCSDMLIWGANYSQNKMGPASTGNIIQGSWYNNNFGPNFSNNYGIYMNHQYWWGMTHNTFGSNYTNNFHTAEFNNNLVSGGLLANNMFQWNCQRNVLEGFFYSNLVGGEFEDNHMQFVNQCVFGQTCSTNLIVSGAAGDMTMVLSSVGDRFKCNNIRSMYSCTVGNDFQYNMIQGVFKTITVPDSVQYNKFLGKTAANTYLAAGSNHNVFNNDFGGGTLAVPLNLVNCVFNQPVSGLQVSNTGVTFIKVTLMSSITNKTIPSSLSGVTVQASADGTLWALTVQNTTGSLTTTIII
jgi:hypothetical protein